jgi:hypothetical protein
MTATLDDVTAKKKRPEPTAEEAAAAELVRRMTVMLRWPWAHRRR